MSGAQSPIPQDQMNSAWSPGQPAPTPAPTSSPASAPAPAQLPPSMQFQGANGSPPAASPISNMPNGPAPIVAKPEIDPRPYALLAENNPSARALVDKIADEAQVSPARLAWHWWKEGGFKLNTPDGKAGEVGPMQVLPDTAAKFNARGQLDPRQPADNLLLGARYIHYLDSRYGKDSPSSVGAYQGGEGSIEDIAAHPDQAAQRHPNTMSYTRSAFVGSPISGGSFIGAGSMTPKGIVDAAVQGGPDGYLRYVTQTAPRGMPMGDAMRQAESTLMGWAAARGDYAGMQHAKDFILQLSHAGSNSNLMAAYSALQAGDGVSASQYLAKAHAFFPDGTIGQFGVDKSGNVWGQRFDENDPSRALSPPFQVTPEGVATLLNQTTNPAQFLQMAQEEQKTAAYIRHTNTMGDYYSGLLDERKRNDEAVTDERLQAANIRAGATVSAAEIRAGRQGYGPANQLAREVDKEGNALYGDLGPYGETPVEQRGQMNDIYADMRMNGQSPMQARATVEGIINKKLGVVRGQDGTYGVVNPKSGRSIAYLSQDLGDRLFGGSGPAPAQPGRAPMPGAINNQPGRSPIGASASSPYARGAGVTNNLTGTVMPQAPVPPAQQQGSPINASSAMPPGGS